MLPKSLIRLLIANAVSGVSQGIMMVAVPWYFANHLKKSEWFGVIYAGATLATLFWSLYAGTLIDKHSRKKIFLWINASGFFFQGFLALAGSIYGDMPWMAASAFVYTMFTFNIHFPSLYAFAQEVSAKQDYARVNSWLEITHQSMSVVSGGIAAILIGGITRGSLLFEVFRVELAPRPLHEIIALDALTYLLAWMIVQTIEYVPEQERLAEKGSVLERFKQGVRFLLENPGVRTFGWASYVIFILLLIEVHQLLPVYVDRHLQSNGNVYALSEMIYAVGALAAGLWMRKTLKFFHPVKTIMVMMIFTAFLFAGCFVMKSEWYILLFSVLIGVTNAGTRILRVTWLFEHVPNRVIGRVNSVFNAFNILSRTLLGLIFSLKFFNSGGNIRYAYLICGVILLIASVVLLVNMKKIQATTEKA